MQEALRTYLEVAMGISEMSRKKVRKAVKDMVGKGNATAEQVKSLTSELMAANSANREALTRMVKFEVDRALAVVGLATADEVNELTARVHELERQLRAAQGTGPAAAATAAAATTGEGPAAAKKAVAKKAAKAARVSVAETETATSVPAEVEPPAKATAVKRAAAKKAVAAKKAPATAAVPAKKAPATAVPAKKAAPARRSASVSVDESTTRATPSRTAAKKAAAKKSSTGASR